ncbi:hypothetical protein CRYUN_Cryun37aG0128300 [Craigia yunnanensis]
MEGEPVAFHGDILPRQHGRRFDPKSEASKVHAKKLVDAHGQVLQSTLETGSYNKLYSFKHVLNGFSVHTSPSQGKKLKHAPGVKLVERDGRTKLMTTYSPQFLGLPEGVWTQGGHRNEGEGILGAGAQAAASLNATIDIPSPSDVVGQWKPRGISCRWKCWGPQFPAFSCNGKIVSARFFIAGAQAAASLNATIDIPSPSDAVGQWKPRGINCRWKCWGPCGGERLLLWASQWDGTACKAIVDGVDFLTLWIGPDEPPQDTVTFLSNFDIAMLFARRAGIFVPLPGQKRYPGSLLLGNGQNVSGVGLSAPTFGNGSFFYKLVLAKDAVNLNGTFPRTPQYVEECQYPEALDPNVVRGSIVICTFSAGFYNETSTLTAINDTARTLGYMGFLLAANPSYGDFIAQSIPYSVSGTLIPKVADAKVTVIIPQQAISITATKFDNNGGLIMAEGSLVGSLYSSTYFDFGAGFVSPSHAMDQAYSYHQNLKIISVFVNIDRFAIRAATGVWCSQSLGHPANLNTPSVTISDTKITYREAEFQECSNQTRDIRKLSDTTKWDNNYLASTLVCYSPRGNPRLGHRNQFYPVNQRVQLRINYFNWEFKSHRQNTSIS